MQNILESYLEIVNKAVFDTSELAEEELPSVIAKQYLDSDQHAVRSVVAQSSDFCDEVLVFPDANVIYPDMQAVYPDTNSIHA